MTRSNRSTVSREFREGIKETYPGLEEIVEFWALMEYLIFGKKCEYTGYPLIDSFSLAKAQGKKHTVKVKNYVGKTFLYKFQQQVMTPETFTWSNWSYQNSRARVAFVTFPEEIQTLINKELINNTTDRVYFITGNVFSKARVKTQRDVIKSEVSTHTESAIPEVKPLLNYMNNLPVHSFSKVVEKNWDAAWLKLNTIEDSLKFNVQAEIMAVIREYKQPFYKPS
jgi:hypothetical protein